MRNTMPKLTAAMVYRCDPQIMIMLAHSELDGLFAEREIHDPQPTQWCCSGFTRMPNGDWVLATDDHVMVCIQFNDRTLPSSVRDKLVNQKADEIERQQGRRPHKKEMRLLLDEAETELLPKAFIRSSVTPVTFTDEGYMIIWTTSVKKADAIIANLLPFAHDCADECGVKLADPVFSNVQTRVPVQQGLTAILKDEPGSSEQLHYTTTGVLKVMDAAVSEKPVIRIRNKDMGAHDIQRLVNSDGCVVIELGMTFDKDGFDDEDAPDLQFTLTENMQFKKINAGVKPERGEDAVLAFDGLSFLTTRMLILAHKALIEEFGGVLSLGTLAEEMAGLTADMKKTAEELIHPLQKLANETGRPVFYEDDEEF